MNLLYFAYGSNMNDEHMARLCPGAEVVGAATLPGYRFIINRNGYATLRAEPDAEIAGLLWRIEAHHEAALDAYEGYRDGLYDKCFRKALPSDGQQIQALVYIDHGNHTLGHPDNGYLEQITLAAQAHDLPGKHLALLRAWPRKPVFTAFNKLVNWTKTERSNAADLPPRLAQTTMAHYWRRPRIGDCRHEVVCWLKAHRDDLILKALDEFCLKDREATLPDKAGTTASFEEFFLETALTDAEEMAWKYEEEYQDKAMGESALQYVLLGRFNRSVKSLLREENRLEEIKNRSRPDEIAGLGIIITNDPCRNHHPEDRFILTQHAPALASLWHHLFDVCQHRVHPRTYPYIEIFAEAAAGTGESTDAVLRHVLRRISTAVQQQLKDREDKLDDFEVDEFD